MDVDAEAVHGLVTHQARRLQRAAAALALLGCALPAMVTAGLVWFSVGRPLFFRQVRSGLDGRPFTVVKFRTMHDLRDMNGSLLPDSERQTAITRFVRAVRLDEIPQLLAIAAGDMNFVGPRPLPASIVASFGALGAVRCAVRPGLTGWAQVNGNTRLTDAEKLALDIWYIDHRTPRLDAQILFLTAAAVLRGERVNQARVTEALAHLKAHHEPVDVVDAHAKGAAS